MTPNHPNENLGKTRCIRHDLRIPTSLLVDVILENSRNIFGKIEDLSLNGAKLRLPMPAAIGSKLTLSFPERQLTLKGICRWSLSEGWSGSSYLSGICFNDLSVEQYAQLRQVLFSLTG